MKALAACIALSLFSLPVLAQQQTGPPPGYQDNGSNAPPPGYQDRDGPPPDQQDQDNEPPPGYYDDPQAGPPPDQGSGQEGPPPGYNDRQGGSPPGSGNQQGGPPPGYDDQRGGPPPGYDDQRGGPPPGYDDQQDGPPPDYGNQQGGPPPGYNDQQGGPPPGYDNRQGGPPPGYQGTQRAAPYGDGSGARGAAAATTRIPDALGGWILITSDANWQAKWQTTSSTPPTFTVVRDLDRGKKAFVLIFLANPKLDAAGQASVSCDIDVTRPDGSSSVHQPGATCFTGKPGGDARDTYLAAPVIGFVGDPGDPVGTWRVKVTLRDNNRHSTMPLQATFNLKR